MKILDLKSLNGKSLGEIIDYADYLSTIDSEQKLLAHKIYSHLLNSNQVENVYKHPYAMLRGSLRQKIWDLEKSLNQNEIYYSQSGQDKFIYDNFYKNKKKGFFVEVGAYDGVSGSNCFFFEKFLQWDGIAIEPSSRNFENLKKNRKCKCYNKALTKNPQSMEFIDVINGPTQMSGLNDDYYKKNYELIKQNIHTKIIKKNILTSTFSDIVNKNYVIDYLSIDVEGRELDILESINFDIYNIKILTIENNYPDQIQYKDYLLKKGFKYFDKIGMDELYLSKKHFY